MRSSVILGPIISSSMKSLHTTWWNGRWCYFTRGKCISCCTLLTKMKFDGDGIKNLISIEEVSRKNHYRVHFFYVALLSSPCLFKNCIYLFITEQLSQSEATESVLELNYSLFHKIPVNNWVFGFLSCKP